MGIMDKFKIFFWMATLNFTIAYGQEKVYFSRDTSILSKKIRKGFYLENYNNIDLWCNLEIRFIRNNLDTIEKSINPTRCTVRRKELI